MVNLPKDLREIHKLGSQTREWLVRPRQVPSFVRTHTRVVGYTHAHPGYRFVRHAPDFAQILACTDGEGWVWVDGRWSRCRPGMAYLNAPLSPSAYHVQKGDHWKVCWVIFETPGALPGLEPRRPARLVSADARGLMGAIQGLCHEAAGEADATSVQLLSSLVHRFAVRTVGASPRDARLDQLWQDVRERIAEPWSLARMAKRVGASEETLRRLTQRHLGQSPSAQLGKLRMGVAADLLMTSSETVASIAERVGYEDAFAFSHAFKREHSISPRAYRARGDVSSLREGP